LIFSSELRPSVTDDVIIALRHHWSSRVKLLSLWWVCFGPPYS